MMCHKKSAKLWQPFDIEVLIVVYISVCAGAHGSGTRRSYVCKSCCNICLGVSLLISQSMPRYGGTYLVQVRLSYCKSANVSLRNCIQKMTSCEANGTHSYCLGEVLYVLYITVETKPNDPPISITSNILPPF
jgi:hypothetical protein